MPKSIHLRDIALTIAGSDSSTAAGVQGDLKTFSALGVYACTVITAITAQNTREIISVTALDSKVISQQISCILHDIPPNAIKIGMIHNISAIKAAANALRLARCPIILDPIMYATNKVKLIEEEAIDILISTLAPACHVITPNIHEAERISGQRIKTQEDISKAARSIQKLGARNIIIKGGHSSGKISTDYLLQEGGDAIRISSQKIQIKDIHGSGCNFSAALTAYIAQKFSLRESFELANKWSHKSIQNVSRIGKGLPITDPLFSIYKNASRFDILKKTQEAVDYIESIAGLGLLIPETQSNIVFALKGAETVGDVAGIRGRIVRIGDRAKASSCVQFGSSSHVANAVLAYNAHNSKFRSAMNIKFDHKIKAICNSRFVVSSYDRSNEPTDARTQDGRTILWGVAKALRQKPDADVIYHTGEVGKEAMTLVFGYEPFDVVNKLKIILKEYQPK
jgi:hydroxymethylpyrimidine kinase / phosphomethylpyrimidine kinase / thiamine-phosphate diphosphorylase